MFILAMLKVGEQGNLQNKMRVLNKVIRKIVISLTMLEPTPPLIDENNQIVNRNET